ncbi:hypothetical protein ARMSODRAFT_972542 [Armillaria solidipes]|uniref:Uncharacterized protein n=1 Tax=Armillaria solidipes TaxID=1076256 RepID=A0A2H3CCI2_9AGAR|nr:hypothetical protein ARMSODRAFT_972542 [Armillaria solidipes]
MCATAAARTLSSDCRRGWKSTSTERFQVRELRINAKSGSGFMKKTNGVTNIHGKLFARDAIRRGVASTPEDRYEQESARWFISTQHHLAEVMLVTLPRKTTPQQAHKVAKPSVGNVLWYSGGGHHDGRNGVCNGLEALCKVRDIDSWRSQHSTRTWLFE